MTNPKKRLKEIIKKVYGQYPDNAGLAPTKEDHTEAIIEILKEFVHKDNLPSVDEIEYVLKTPKLHIKKLMTSTLDEYWTKIIKDGIKIDFRTIAKAIRKLIEGNK